MQGVVVAKVAIQHQVGHREDSSDQVEQGRQHRCDPHQLWTQRGGGLGGVLAALRSSWPPRSLGRFGLAGSFFRVAADNLLDAHGKRPPFLDTHEGQGEEGQPWHRLAVQTGEETILILSDFVVGEESVQTIG